MAIQATLSLENEATSTFYKSSTISLNPTKAELMHLVGWLDFSARGFVRVLE
jgi:hypothetical protein